MSDTVYLVEVGAQELVLVMPTEPTYQVAINPPVALGFNVSLSSGGIQGPKGEQGDRGEVGPTGADSIVPGPTGDQGLRGIQGVTGDQGSVGPRGSIFLGVYPTEGDLPVIDGVNALENDYALTADGTLYQVSS